MDARKDFGVRARRRHVEWRRKDGAHL
jgi:hypothetical protein